jgi:hypothetical protein
MSGGSAEICTLPSGQGVGPQRRLIRSGIKRFYPEFCCSLLFSLYCSLLLLSIFIWVALFMGCPVCGLPGSAISHSHCFALHATDSFFFFFFFNESVVIGLGLLFNGGTFLRTKRGLSLRFVGSLNADKSGNCLKGPSGGVVSSSVLECAPFEGVPLILESMDCCLKSLDIVLYGSSEHKM